MSTISHEPSAPVRVERRRSVQLLVPEMWAALAIIVMWLAVLVDALWGPDIVSSSGAGTNHSTVPSAIVLAGCATLGTWVVAKYGFGHKRKDEDSG